MIIVCLLVLTSFQLATITGTSIQSINLNPKGSEFATPLQIQQFSRPIVESVKFTNGTSVPVLRSRNDSLNLGGIYKAQVGQNYSFTYLVINGSSTTLPLFHSDALGINSSLNFANKSVPKFRYLNTVNVPTYKLPYDPFTTLKNVTYSRYEYNFTLKSSFSQFFVEVNGLADTGVHDVRNLISDNVTFGTKPSTNFYIQTENVTFVLNGFNKSTGVFGFAYKTTQTPLTKFANFSSVATFPGNLFNSTYNLGKFKPGVNITWTSTLYIFDPHRNTTYFINNIDYHMVEVVDGKPKVNLTVKLSDNTAVFTKINNTYYSNKTKFTLNYTSVLAKGNLSEYTMTIKNLSDNSSTVSVIKSGNSSQLTFKENNRYNLTFVALSDKGVNTTIHLQFVIDNVKPTLNLSNSATSLNIQSESRNITFYFNFNDNLSGIKYAILDLGNNVSVEVTGLSSFTYTYAKYNSYTVTLYVVDNAGNMASTTTLFTFVSPTVPQVGAPFSALAFFIGFVALIPIINKRRQD